MRTIISSVLIIVGLIAMAGSANDCGSTCGPGHVPNTIGEMLMVAFIGLAMFLTGSIIAIRGQQ